MTRAEDSLREALAALTAAEELIVGIDRPGILQKLDELRDTVEEISRLQVDVRMARIRVQAALRTGGDPDPDKTPVHGISSDKLRALTNRK